MEELIDVALGNSKAEKVIKNVNILSTVTGDIVKGDIAIENGIIAGVYDQYDGIDIIDGEGLYAVPGFIDCHCHIESSMLTPYEFEKCVLPMGTTTVVCDPSGLCNVCGEKALKYFLDAATKLTMDLQVALSSCVPATHMETSGAELTADTLKKYVDYNSHVAGLGELDYHGVLDKDAETLKKMALCYHIDGHAPQLSRKELNAYIANGIFNDHEVSSAEEALEKLRKGMYVFMREGTVYKDLKNFYSLLNEYNSIHMALCSADRNCCDIINDGHINYMIKKMIKNGVKPHIAYRTASLSGAMAFGFYDRGIIAPGKRADIVLVSNLEKVTVEKVIANGKIVDDSIFIENDAKEYKFALNTVKIKNISKDNFIIDNEEIKNHVIGFVQDKIVTEHLSVKDLNKEKDLAKVCILHRYGKNGNIGKAYVKGLKFTEKNVAVASTVAYNSHNLCVIGDNDEDMSVAIDAVIKMNGGMVLVSNGKVLNSLALPVGGIISDKSYDDLYKNINSLKQRTRKFISGTSDIFMQMAFLSYISVPHLKITDMGLIDIDESQFI